MEGREGRESSRSWRQWTPRTAPRPTATGTWACPSLGCPPTHVPGPSIERAGRLCHQQRRSQGQSQGESHSWERARGTHVPGTGWRSGAASSGSSPRPPEAWPARTPPPRTSSQATERTGKAAEAPGARVRQGPLSSPSGCHSGPWPSAGSASPTETPADKVQPDGCPPVPHSEPPERLFPGPGSSPSQPPCPPPPTAPGPQWPWEPRAGCSGEATLVHARSGSGHASPFPARISCARLHLLCSHKAVRPRARLCHAGSPVQVPGRVCPALPAQQPRLGAFSGTVRTGAVGGATASPSGLGATGLSPGQTSTWTLRATRGAALGLAPRSVPP